MDNIVFIIFLIIFFGGPLIKKILEAINEASPPPKHPSKNEVQEYLEKMRGTHQQPQASKSQYQATSTKPSMEIKPKVHPNKAKAKKHEQVPEVIVIEPKQKTLAESLEEKDAINPQPPIKIQGRKQNIKNAMVLLNDKVMANPRFTDAQKAIVLREIFGKPKALEKGML